MPVRHFIYLMSFSASIFAGCGNTNPEAASDSTTLNTSASPAVAADTTALPPVEKNEANTNYKPAFPGQTRVKGVKTSTAYAVDELTTKLDHPWAVVPTPDGRLMITEKSGGMQILSTDGAVLKKITGFPKVNDGGQGGMLDVAFDPDYAQNRTIYWTYAESYGKGQVMALAKGQLSTDETKIENPTVIFRATPDLGGNMHFGSRIAFDKDKNMFVTTGERSNLNGRKQSQWLNSGLGKIFKLTREGKPADGNPFIGKGDAKPEIYSYGHRNPQSLAIHPETGDVWEAEFGPRGGDELNLIKAGKNYGWPIITYGLEYSGSKVGDAIQQKEGMEQPVYYWDPVLSPSGMVFYAGDAIPEWKNNLFIGGLSSNHIARLVIDGNRVVGEERILADKSERFRDVAYHDGKLYAVTDGGKLYRISRK